MPSPLDIMLDHVDWKCLKCGVSQSIGCDCIDKAEADKRAAIRSKYNQLMQLSDADLIAECQKLGVKI